MRKLYWTEDLLMCYENKFYCKNCELYEICKNIKTINDYGIKHMKYTVLKLISLYGLNGIREFKRKINKY